MNNIHTGKSFKSLIGGIESCSHWISHCVARHPTILESVILTKNQKGPFQSCKLISAVNSPIPPLKKREIKCGRNLELKEDATYYRQGYQKQNFTIRILTKHAIFQ